MKYLKTVFVVILILIPIFIFKIPEYVELNDLAIIEGIGLSCHEDGVTLYLKEVVPVKSDAGITYQYNYYQSDGKKLDNAYQKIQNKEDKKIFMNRSQYIVTNCTSTDFIFEYFHLYDLKIQHADKNIVKQLKKTKP